MGKKIILAIHDERPLGLDIKKNNPIGLNISKGSGGGTKNYEQLENKPRINGVELIGNKTSAQIYVQDIMDEITEQEIDTIIYGG